MSSNTLGSRLGSPSSPIQIAHPYYDEGSTTSQDAEQEQEEERHNDSRLRPARHGPTVPGRGPRRDKAAAGERYIH